jgi:hypothetical protein
VVLTELTYYRDAFGCKGANPLNGGLEMGQALANARSKDGKTDRTELSNKPFSFLEEKNSDTHVWCAAKSIGTLKMVEWQPIDSLSRGRGPADCGP